MEVRVDVDLPPEDMTQLAGILECDPSDLGEALQPYGRAAVLEHIRMFLGQRVFTRGSDIHEYRLFLLIQEAFGNRIPREEVVCNLFQATATQARSLTRSVMSKYQYSLQDAIQLSLREAVEGAVQDENDGDWMVVINNRNIVEALNRVIQTIDGTLPQVERQRGTVSTYVLRASTRARLAERFELPELAP